MQPISKRQRDNSHIITSIRKHNYHTIDIIKQMNRNEIINIQLEMKID